MVKIRLQRRGAKKRPFYRIVAIDERRQLNGRALALLGTYDPRPEREVVAIDNDAVDAWVAKGAQLSSTVRTLMQRTRKAAAAAQGAS